MRGSSYPDATIPQGELSLGDIVRLKPGRTSRVIPQKYWASAATLHRLDEETGLALIRYQDGKGFKTPPSRLELHPSVYELVRI